MARQYNEWSGEPSGFTEIDARDVVRESRRSGYRHNPPNRNRGWAPYRSHNRGSSYFDTTPQQELIESEWVAAREAGARTGAGWGRSADSGTMQQQQMGGGWGNRQLAEERAREGWGRPNTDHPPRRVGPNTSGNGPYSGNGKPQAPTEEAGETRTEEEEDEKWNTISGMEGGHDLMDEFKCIICHGMLCKPCLSLTCAHRFCEECITRWIKRSPSCPECRNYLSENELRCDRCVTNIMEKVVLLRWPGQSAPHK
jgi:hypothetical protein